MEIRLSYHSLGLERDQERTDQLQVIIKKFIAINYNVELEDFELSILRENMPGILLDLQDNDFYLMHMDITQYFLGIFNKWEMCEYLSQNNSFRYPNDKHKENFNTYNCKERQVYCDSLPNLDYFYRCRCKNLQVHVPDN